MPAYVLCKRMNELFIIIFGVANILQDLGMGLQLRRGPRDNAICHGIYQIVATYGAIIDIAFGITCYYLQFRCPEPNSRFPQ